MRTRTSLSILFLLLVGTLLAQNVVNDSITCILKDASLTEFIQEIEKNAMSKSILTPLMS